MRDLTPRQIVDELDRHIVGQHDAKRAVAIAIRNRWRRQQLADDMKAEVAPKNILMIGPTGVGKTEIARRIAKLVGAPFVKVEATKFTEVGYVGRDVDSMVRDLVEASLRMVKAERRLEVADAAAERTTERLLDALVPLPAGRAQTRNPLEALFSGGQPTTDPDAEADLLARRQAVGQRRQEARQQLLAGDLEGEAVEIEVAQAPPALLGVLGGDPGGAGLPPDAGAGLADLLSNLGPQRSKKRRLSVAEARRVLLEEEAARLIDQDQAVAVAIARAEDGGIIFIDELDKVAVRGGTSGADVSREGVQRDLLPIVEGSTVPTRYGPVRTDH
ncbi:MAG TPA: ATP-dependent protease ATPase subunit HslU, partial [Pirellulales bacterium]|nr:ATP-dependent protease ATPase subunit HslU [Pirellulales bacterium]